MSDKNTLKNGQKTELFAIKDLILYIRLSDIYIMVFP
jgi:hypothetical protein